MPRMADPVVRYPEKDVYWRQRIYWMVLWELIGTVRGRESKPCRMVNVLERGNGEGWREGWQPGWREKCSGWRWVFLYFKHPTWACLEPPCAGEKVVNCLLPPTTGAYSSYCDTQKLSKRLHISMVYRCWELINKLKVPFNTGTL